MPFLKGTRQGPHLIHCQDSTLSFFRDSQWVIPNQEVDSGCLLSTELPFWLGTHEHELLFFKDTSYLGCIKFPHLLIQVLQAGPWILVVSQNGEVYQYQEADLRALLTALWEPEIRADYSFVVPPFQVFLLEYQGPATQISADHGEDLTLYILQASTLVHVYKLPAWEEAPLIGFWRRTLETICDLRQKVPQILDICNAEDESIGVSHFGGRFHRLRPLRRTLLPRDSADQLLTPSRYLALSEDFRHLESRDKLSFQGLTLHLHLLEACHSWAANDRYVVLAYASKLEVLLLEEDQDEDQVVPHFSLDLPNQGVFMLDQDINVLTESGSFRQLTFPIKEEAEFLAHKTSKKLIDQTKGLMKPIIASLREFSQTFWMEPSVQGNFEGLSAHCSLLSPGLSTRHSRHASTLQHIGMVLIARHAEENHKYLQGPDNQALVASISKKAVQYLHIILNCQAAFSELPCAILHRQVQMIECYLFFLESRLAVQDLLFAEAATQLKGNHERGAFENLDFQAYEDWLWSSCPSNIRHSQVVPAQSGFSQNVLDFTSFSSLSLEDPGLIDYLFGRPYVKPSFAERLRQYLVLRGASQVGQTFCHMFLRWYFEVPDEDWSLGFLLLKGEETPAMAPLRGPNYVLSSRAQSAFFESEVWHQDQLPYEGLPRVQYRYTLSTELESTQFLYPALAQLSADLCQEFSHTFLYRLLCAPAIHHLRATALAQVCALEFIRRRKENLVGVYVPLSIQLQSATSLRAELDQFGPLNVSLSVLLYQLPALLARCRVSFREYTRFNLRIQDLSLHQAPRITCLGYFDGELAWPEEVAQPSPNNSWECRPNVNEFPRLKREIVNPNVPPQSLIDGHSALWALFNWVKSPGFPEFLAGQSRLPPNLPEVVRDLCLTGPHNPRETRTLRLCACFLILERALIPRLLQAGLSEVAAQELEMDVVDLAQTLVATLIAGLEDKKEGNPFIMVGDQGLTSLMPRREHPRFGFSVEQNSEDVLVILAFERCQNLAEFLETFRECQLLMDMLVILNGIQFPIATADFQELFPLAWRLQTCWDLKEVDGHQQEEEEDFKFVGENRTNSLRLVFCRKLCEAQYLNEALLLARRFGCLADVEIQVLKYRLRFLDSQVHEQLLQVIHQFAAVREVVRACEKRLAYMIRTVSVDSYRQHSFVLTAIPKEVLDYYLSPMFGLDDQEEAAILRLLQETGQWKLLLAGCQSLLGNPVVRKVAKEPDFPQGVGQRMGRARQALNSLKEIGNAHVRVY